MARKRRLEPTLRTRPRSSKSESIRTWLDGISVADGAIAEDSQQTPPLPPPDHPPHRKTKAQQQKGEGKGKGKVIEIEDDPAESSAVFPYSPTISRITATHHDSSSLHSASGMIREQRHWLLCAHPVVEFLQSCDKTKPAEVQRLLELLFWECVTVFLQI